MSDATPRFGLPFILPGQAQKEIYHNEALMLIDAALQAAVEGAPLAEPPAAPSLGQSWIVASSPSGAWAAKADQLAIWSEGGWRFVEPAPGMAAWDKQAQRRIHWNGAEWSAAMPVGSLVIAGQQVVGSRQPAVPSPSGGTVIDAEARVALAALTAAIKSHGLIE
jgi:hypothetical protein